MEIDQNIRTFGKEHKIPITLDDTLELLINTIKTEGAKEILEIGTAIGFGSISMAKNTNLDHIDTVEINEQNFNIAVKNVQSANLTDKITVYHQDAKEYLENCTKMYDFVYLDGPKGQYINYLPKILNILKPNGIIFADNIFFHGMVYGDIETPASCRAMIKGLRKYIEECMSRKDLSSKIISVGDGVCISKKIK